MSKIKDFGEKIGGARKDLWKENGLSVADLSDLNEAEQEKYVTKNYVWPMPSGKRQVESGTDVFVAYWQRTVRKKAFTAPHLYRAETKLQSIENYIVALQDLKAKVMSCKNMDDVRRFEKESKEGGYDYKHWEDAIRVRELRALEYQKGSLCQKMKHANFPDGRKRSGAKRKRKFTPPQLEHLERTGIDYRHGQHITPKRWQNEFGFRGVEFGNWCSQKDRQISMDLCYEALKDLAATLRIEDTDLTFDGYLALAFGARGHSSANAHYEPFRKVINLTKMNGAGCTAHEWMHALDHYIAICCGQDGVVLASNLKNRSVLPESFVRLVDALSKDADGNHTDFYRGSKRFDGEFSRDSFGYWSSPSEMLARAFACYVKDTLGEKSDYLIAHADCYEFEFDCQSICAIPQGEERELFNELFDQLFFDLKQNGILHQRTEKQNTIVPHHTVEAIDYDEDDDGQLLMFF